MPELIGLSDRILVMSGGRITGEVTGADMTEANILALAMPSRERPAMEPARERETAA